MAYLEELQSSALKLPLAERVQLVQALLASLEQESAPDVDDTWLEELRRRYTEYKAQTAQSNP